MQKITLGVAITSLCLKLSSKELKSILQKFEKYFDVKLFLPDNPSARPDRFGSVSVEERIKSINNAAEECEIVLSLAGGFNQIELLARFDELKFSKKNIFVGQSDNTILAGALTRSKKCKVLYGNGFYGIMRDPKLLDKRIKSLYDSAVKLRARDPWLIGGKALQSGQAKGRLVGGNNYTFDLLQGTKFCPRFNRSFVLFMEGEDILKESSETWIDFIRNIDSILLQKGANRNLKGIILGRFPSGIKLKGADYQKFLEDRPWLKGIPIIIDYECGHNQKSYKYLPIGEKIKIKC